MRKTLKIFAYLLISVGVLHSLTGMGYNKYGGWYGVSPSKGLIEVFLGLALLIGVKKYFKGKKDPIEYSKCPKCGKAYSYSVLEKGICPTCNVETVDLKEYYKND